MIIKFKDDGEKIVEQFRVDEEFGELLLKMCRYEKVINLNNNEKGNNIKDFEEEERKAILDFNVYADEFWEKFRYSVIIFVIGLFVGYLIGGFGI